MTPEAWWPKKKQMNWTLSKLKPLLHQRILSRGWKDSPQNGRKYCKLCDTAIAAAKLLQSCLTLCDPIDSSPPGSSIPGILQARTLEWVAISFVNAWKWKVKVKSLSGAQLLATPSTAAYQAPPSMGFSRQEYWSGCHCLLRLTFLIRPHLPTVE